MLASFFLGGMITVIVIAIIAGVLLFAGFTVGRMKRK